MSVCGGVLEVVKVVVVVAWCLALLIPEVLQICSHFLVV